MEAGGVMNTPHDTDRASPGAHDHGSHDDGGHDHRGHGRFPGLGRTEVTRSEELTPVDEQLAYVREHVPDFDPIHLRSEEALGLVLAEDVVGQHPLPAFANSAMDGYAVQAADLAGATQADPVILWVTGEVPAGAAELPRVETGTAAEIMTGAPLPPGADAVVPVETTSRDEDRVRVHVAVDPGRHVRRVGEDVSPGQQLLSAGHRVGPEDIGLLAAVGMPRVSCYPAPRVAVLATGDELVPAHASVGPGQIRDANGPMMAAMVREAGGISHRTEIVADEQEALIGALDSSLSYADVVVATGGASVGAYDLIEEVVGELGQVRASKVAMKPGKPQIFGLVRGVPVFGLPGNPVSAFVSFEVFVRPLLRRMLGRSGPSRPVVTARLAEPAPGAGPRRHYLRVRLSREGGGWTARPIARQGSHVLTSVVRAHGLAEIPEGTDELPAGESVRVNLLVDA